MDLTRLYDILNTLWVVWFFLLFLGMLWYVLRPSKRDYYRKLGNIPFDGDDADNRPAGRL